MWEGGKEVVEMEVEDIKKWVLMGGNLEVMG